MTDPEIRAVLIPRLRRSLPPNTLLVEELCLRHGVSRADVTLYGATPRGFEIKSGQDSLSRLKFQIGWYGMVMDRMTVVTEPNHLKRVREIVPAWWGIEGVVPGGIFATLREGQRNPEPYPYAILELLWRDEVRDICERAGIARGVRGKSCWHMHGRIIDHYTVDEIWAMVGVRLRSRTTWRTEANPPSPTGHPANSRPPASVSP